MPGRNNLAYLKGIKSCFTRDLNPKNSYEDKSKAVFTKNQRKKRSLTMFKEKHQSLEKKKVFYGLKPLFFIVSNILKTAS